MASEVKRGSNKIQCQYLYQGLSTQEYSYMKIQSDYEVTTEGTTAKATITSRMYIMRDNLYPSSIGPGYSGGYGPNYINISGSQEGRINPTANYTKVITVRDSYVQVGNAVTHTVTYP